MVQQPANDLFRTEEVPWRTLWIDDDRIIIYIGFVPHWQITYRPIDIRLIFLLVSRADLFPVVRTPLHPLLEFMVFPIIGREGLLSRCQRQAPRELISQVKHSGIATSFDEQSA